MSIINIPFETMGLSKTIRLKQYFVSFVRHSTIRKLLNFLKIEFQVFIKSDRLTGMPYILKIENTNICNFQCPICYENRKQHDYEGARGYGRMELQHFQKIVNELYPWVYRINLYGFGEPFLFDEIFDMISYATNHNISVAITSNFNTVNQDKINKILDSGLEHLVISIDGVDQKTYEKYQVGGNFDKVISNIQMLMEAKKEKKAKYPIVDWQFLIMRHNHHLQEKAAEIARSLGVGIRFSRIGVDLTNDKECSEWLPDVNIREQLNFEDCIIKKQKQIPLCTWLYRTAFINWDLGVSPCCNYYTGEKNHDFGNLKVNSFSVIWNNDRYIEARRMFKERNGNYSNENICYKCIAKRKRIREYLQHRSE